MTFTLLKRVTKGEEMLNCMPNARPLSSLDTAGQCFKVENLLHISYCN